MDANFRSLFLEELDSTPEPGLGDLIPEALRQGKKIRRTRVLYRSALAGALGVVIAGVAVVNPLPGGGASPSKRVGPAAAPAPQSAVTPSDPAPSEPVKMAKTTPEGLLVLLLQDLPKGKTSHYAKSDPTTKGKKGFLYEDMARTYLDTGNGPGMVRLFVQPPMPGQNLTPAEKKKRDKKLKELGLLNQPDPVKEKVWKLPDGRTATIRNLGPGKNLNVWVSREDGWSVNVFVPAYLAFNGKENKAAPVVLTEEQALKIAEDPRIGKELPAAVVEQGAKDFPHLAIDNA